MNEAACYLCDSPRVEGQNVCVEHRMVGIFPLPLRTYVLQIGEQDEHGSKGRSNPLFAIQARSGRECGAFNPSAQKCSWGGSA